MVKSNKKVIVKNMLRIVLFTEKYVSNKMPTTNDKVKKTGMYFNSFIAG